MRNLLIRSKPVTNNIFANLSVERRGSSCLTSTHCGFPGTNRTTNEIAWLGQDVESDDEDDVEMDDDGSPRLIPWMR